GGLGGIIIYLLINFLGGNSPDLQQIAQQPQTQEQKAEDDSVARFVSVVLANTEDVWNALFKTMGKYYSDPTWVLFTQTDQSGCGFASAATGPFYCPEDQKVYLDLEFFQELQTRFKAAGDFAQAYVVAHEIGHHVQKQLGILDQVNGKRGRISAAEYNKLSV